MNRLKNRTPQLKKNRSWLRPSSNFKHKKYPFFPSFNPEENCQHSTWKPTSIACCNCPCCSSYSCMPPTNICAQCPQTYSYQMSPSCLLLASPWQQIVLEGTARLMAAQSTSQLSMLLFTDLTYSSLSYYREGETLYAFFAPFLPLLGGYIKQHSCFPPISPYYPCKPL